MAEKGFSDIFEEMTWTMFKMSEGNPYIAQELVSERNKVREQKKEQSDGMTK